LSNEFIWVVRFADSNNATGVGVGVGVPPPHRTRIKAAWNVLAARNTKSVGCAGLGVVNVTTTGANVPGVNGGMVTTALLGAATTIIDCVPVPALT